MKRHMNKVYRGLVIFGGIAVLLGVCRGLGNTAQALTYQNEANVEFGINPTIGVSLSASGLVIDNLVPGTSANSNIITVSVDTNASHGYYLSATAGTAGGNTDLTMTNPANSNYKFTNLTGNKATLDSFEDNNWGYSYCLTTNDCTNTTNWVSGNYGSTSAGYNGLPLDNNDNGATGVTLINTTSPVANNSVQFKIGAKASNAQAAGTYTGTVNFYAVTNKPPVSFSDAFASAGKEKLLGFYKMQDMNSSICNAVEQGLTGILIDVRDNHTYYVAKLDDNKCWMTQNLDLAIGMNGTATLTSENTDLTISGTGIYTTGYSTDGNGIIAWTPENSTLTGNPATITNFTTGDPENSVSGWTSTPTAAQMAEGGNHWLAKNTLFTTREDCVSAYGAVVCDHGQVGNYYNWTASVASNDSTAQFGRYATAGNSICPKGWRLPKGPDGENGSEFNTLLSEAKIANGTDDGAGNAQNVGFKADGLTKMEGAPYYYGRFGYVEGTRLYYLAGGGAFWSASTVSGSTSFSLRYFDSALYPALQSYRDGGWSVRCLAR